MKQLRLETYKMLGVSTGIYVLLFGLLYLTELLVPAMAGKLLQWHLADGSVNWAFIVGIPASVLGTGYVLSIRNPKNYTGFYPGILMSLMLALQFYLQGSMDMVVLYVFVFVPFLISSLVNWRKNTLQPSQEGQPFRPAFVSKRQSLYIHLVAIGIVIADYAFVTLTDGSCDWTANHATKIATGSMIASSFLANLLMIKMRNDAWICWVCYCISGVVLFSLIGNAFSIVLFSVMLLVNLSGQIAWLRQTDESGYGWTAILK